MRGLERPEFVREAARLLGDINALHPFREGNGRTQRAFVQLLARDAGWQMTWAKVGPEVNASRSAAAMHDLDALAPVLDDIVVLGWGARAGRGVGPATADRARAR